MDKLWLALAAWGAGVLVALLGWLQCSDPFNLRKFMASVVRSLIAGIIWAVAYDMNDKPLTFSTVLGAIASGPFFDVLINRVGGLVGHSKFPLPEEKPKSVTPPPVAPSEGTPA